MGHHYSTKAAVGLLAVSLGIMMALAAWIMYRAFYVPHSGDRADAIVVPSGPSREVARALDRAAELFEQGVAPKVVVFAPLQAAEAAGIPRDSTVSVLASYPSGTYGESRTLERVFRNQDWKEAIVVTYPMHMLRTAATFSSRGIEVQQASWRLAPEVGFGKSAENPFKLAWQLAYETAALIYYIGVGYIDFR